MCHEISWGSTGIIITAGVAGIVSEIVGVGVLLALAVGKGVALGAGVVVCSGAQEVRRRARRGMHKSRFCILFHYRVSRRLLPSHGFELRSPAHFAGRSPPFRSAPPKRSGVGV